MIIKNAIEEHYSGKSGLGSFDTAIINTISLADMANLRRIGKSFPVLVYDYLVYMGWDDLHIQGVLQQ